MENKDEKKQDSKRALDEINNVRSRNPERSRLANLDHLLFELKRDVGLIEEEIDQMYLQQNSVKARDDKDRPQNNEELER